MTVIRLAVMAVLCVAGALLGQWPSYSPEQRDLSGPAPKMADGTPDLSGVWEMPRGADGKQLPAAAAAEGAIPLATFRNAGAGFKDGLPFQPWAKELLARRQAQNSKDNPDALCLPMGLMQFHTHGQPRKIVQTKDVIVILYEANGGVRQIFLDGRPLPVDAQPWWYGYSTGKWEGDTLVVETTGLRDDGWLDIIGSPLTDSAKLIERFRRVSYGRMEIEITVDDPKAYTKPWSVRVNHRLMPAAELIEFVCNENDRSRPHMVGK
jgi:hypothetical protein